MAYTYQSFATLGVNLNRQNYGALDISQVFNSQGDLNYYLSKGTDKTAVSDYWKDTVPYPYEGQVLATVFGGEVKVYVLALNAEGNFECQNVGDTSAVEAAVAELEAALATLDGKVGAIPTKEVDGQQVPVASSVIEYINQKTEGIATDAALSELQQAVDALEEKAEEIEGTLADKANTADVVSNDDFATFQETNTQAIADAKAGAESTAASALATARTEISAEIDADVKVAKDRADEAYNLADAKVAKADYEVDKKALQDEDAAIRAIAEGARDTINNFLTSEDIDETVNTLKEIQAEIEKMTDATELAEALASKADKSDTYTKSEVDGFVNAKADAATTYSKDDVDGLLADKADKSNTYTKSEVDGFVNAKANSADVYTKEEANDLLDDKANAVDVYTIDSVDTLLEGKADVATTLAGYGITDAYTKAETDKAIADKVADVTGGESAAAVKLLLEAEVTRSTEKDEAHDSAIETINSKLSGIEAGAQVNKIEVVKVNGTALTIADKAVDITVPTDYLTSVDKNSLTGLINTAQAKAEEADGKADKNAGDISALSGTVSEQGNLIGQHATAITNLETALGATGSTGSKIVALESKAGAHDEAIIAINNTLATKADASVLDNYVLTSAFDTKIADYYTKAQTEAILGNRGDKDIVTLINEAKAAATYNDAEVRGLISANAQAIETNAGNISTNAGAIAKNAEDIAANVLAIAANTKAIADEAARAKEAEQANAKEIERVNGVLVAALENDAEGLDSIKELADWINTHGAEAENMAKAITANTNAISAMDEAYKAADTAIKGRLDVLEAIDHDAYIAADTALETALKADSKSKADAAEANAKAHAEAKVAEVYTQQFIFNGGSASTNLWIEEVTE